MDDDTLLIFGAVAAAGFALYRLSGTVDKVASPLIGVTTGAGTIAREAGETVESVTDMLQRLISKIGNNSGGGSNRERRESPSNQTPSIPGNPIDIVKKGKDAINYINKMRLPTSPAIASYSIPGVSALATPSQMNQLYSVVGLGQIASIRQSYDLSRFSAETKVKTDTFSAAAGRSSPSIQTVSATKSVTQPSVGLKVGSSYTSGSGATVSVKGYTPAKKSTKPRAR